MNAHEQMTGLMDGWMIGFWGQMSCALSSIYPAIQLSTNPACAIVVQCEI
jgi:hypothetical protein